MATETDMATATEIKRNLTNSQKAQILVDLMGSVELDESIDQAISEHSYKVHPEKLQIFKKEMKESFQPFDHKIEKQVKDALAISFKSIAILGKEKIAHQQVVERTRNAHQKVAERTKKQLSSIFA